MKSYRALVVEDEERFRLSIEDVLLSLGHAYEWATNQADAQAQFAAGPFDYMLLDLEIPARPGRRIPSPDCGLNLLRWLRHRSNGHCPPVIIMTGRTGPCADLIRELTSLGAREFIAKPFPRRGRTLCRVIRKVLESPRTVADAEPEWLTVKQCALMLLADVSGLDPKRAAARISWAAGAGKLKTNGQKGAARRIERHSFSTWRLRQRERDLDKADA